MKMIMPNLIVLKVILWDQYKSYKNALNILIETLIDRREKLCLKTYKMNKMFPLNDAQDGHKKATKIATTQPTTQNKTKQVGWSGIIIGKQEGFLLCQTPTSTVSWRMQNEGLRV